MDNIPIGSYVETISSKFESNPWFSPEEEDWSRKRKLKIWLCVKKGVDWPNKGDILLLSLYNLKSRDQILKDGGLCTILVVQKTSKVQKTSDKV